MKTKGWGPWKYEWYNLCSRHFHEVKDDCKACQAGRWVNCWGHFFSHIVYVLCPRVWGWWQNRPNSKAKKFLRQHFPNLR